MKKNKIYQTVKRQIDCPADGVLMSRTNFCSEAGFSLVETMIAVVVLGVALLSVVSAFTYAIKYNTGNNTRSQAIAVMQQEIELLRSAKFTPTTTDSILQGGQQTKTTNSSDNTSFTVLITVDNDPFTSGTQTTEGAAVTLKEITITLTPPPTNQGWANSIPTKATFRRVRAN